MSGQTDYTDAVEKGYACLTRDSAEESIAYFQAALAENSEHPRAHMGLGVAHAQLGRYAASVAALTRAAELDPNNPRIHYNLGLAHERQGQRIEAERCYRAALAADGTYRSARKALEDLRTEPKAVAPPSAGGKPAASLLRADGPIIKQALEMPASALKPSAGKAASAPEHEVAVRRRVSGPSTRPPRPAKRPAGLRGRVSIRQLYRYPVGNEDTFFRRAFVYSLFYNLWMVVLPLIFDLGYLVRVLDSTLRGESDPPEWEHWAQIAKDGAIALGALALYETIPVLLLMLADRLASSSTVSHALSLLGVTLGLVAFAGWLVGLAHYTSSRDLSAWMDFAGVASNVGSNLQSYLMLIVGMVGMAALYIGLMLASPLLAIYYLVKYKRAAREGWSLPAVFFYIGLVLDFFIAWGLIEMLLSPREEQDRGWFIVITGFMVCMMLVGAAIGIMYWYWCSTVTMRMLAHAYRGDQITLRAGA